MNDQLVSYIKQELAQQKSQDDIIRGLIDIGWKKGDVDEAFAVVYNKMPQPTPEEYKTTEQAVYTQAPPDTNVLRTPSIPTSAPRTNKKSIVYAIAIVVIVIAVVAVLFGLLRGSQAVISNSLHNARQRGNDIFIRSEVSTLQTELALYQNEHNTYPSSLNNAAQIGRSIASTVQQLKENGTQYSYEGTSNAYTFCATLSTGSQSCVDSNGQSFIKGK